MPFSRKPDELFAGILADIEKVERFTHGTDFTSFERNDQIAYAVQYALLRASAKPLTDWEV